MLRWGAKIAAFHALSWMPAAQHGYHLLQKNLTGSTIPTLQNVRQKLEVGMTYLPYLHRLDKTFGLDQLSHIDIGAGWMPVIPLLLYSLGVKRQLLCDVYPHIDAATVAEVVRVLREILPSTHVHTEGQLRRLPPLIEPHQSVTDYFCQLGMHYVVPYTPRVFQDMRGPKLITCTQVFPHLNTADLGELLRAVSLALAEGGLFVTTAHLYDLHADWDASISAYNKWRYSDWVWEHVINSRFMSFNRLTASDYRRLFESLGFDCLMFDVTAPSAQELRQVEDFPVHPAFHHKPKEELASSHLFVAAQIRDEIHASSCVS